jgi:hypothetical protein
MAETKLDELWALLAVATPGLWTHGDCEYAIDDDDDGNEIKVKTGWPVPPALVDMGDYQTMRAEDAALAVAAMNALPALLVLAKAAKCEWYRDGCAVMRSCAPEAWCAPCKALDRLGMGAKKEATDG